MTNLSEQHIATIKDAAKKLTGAKRRAFQAQVAIDYVNSKPYLAEKTFGWDRKTVALGLNELRTGLVCFDNFKARGNKKTETKMPQLEIDIVALAEPESQIDPKFQTTFKYTRITAKAMREALMTQKGWKHEELPCEKSISNILNRLGFRLRRVQKAKPLKKVSETDAIFNNLDEINKASDLREDSLRISIDTKAKVDLCDSSRGGTSRCRKAVKANDHDMGLKDKLAPFGILNMMTGLLTIIFGVSFETSDFIVDCLEQWWDDNKDQHSHIKQLVINLDNGPQNSSHRTQFMKRMIDKRTKITLKSCWPITHSIIANITRSNGVGGILENHWSATLLNTLAITLAWAKTMTWKGLSPVVKLLETTYQKGMKMSKNAFAAIGNRIDRNPSLPKYFMTIQPQV